MNNPLLEQPALGEPGPWTVSWVQVEAPPTPWMTISGIRFRPGFLKAP